MIHCFVHQRFVGLFIYVFDLSIFDCIFFHLSMSFFTLFSLLYSFFHLSMYILFLLFISSSRTVPSSIWLLSFPACICTYFTLTSLFSVLFPEHFRLHTCSHLPFLPLTTTRFQPPAICFITSARVFLFLPRYVCLNPLSLSFVPLTHYSVISLLPA